MRLCVTGSRDFTDWPYFKLCLDSIWVEYGQPDLVIHGASWGADAFASKWAYLRKINILPFGAQWGDFGGSAGPRRNILMASYLEPGDVVAAFPLGQSRGTNHMIDTCSKMDGVIVKVFENA